MNCIHNPAAFIAVLLLSVGPLAMGQLPTADMTRIEPRSARAGESVDVILVGNNLEDLTELRFTHPGIVAERVMIPADDIYPVPRHDGSKFRVTIATDVPPGIYEARCSGFYGLSTARPFVVASPKSNEIVESGDHSTIEKAMPLPMDCVVSGAAANRGIDWYRFEAKADQRVLIEVHAERIDSRLDGMLVVYDASGREVLRNREKFGRDPFLELNPPANGEYFLAVSDILYRGGAEHFYRLSVSTGAHIDFIFPPAGLPGTKGKYTLYGRNLPGGSFADSVIVDGIELESLEVEIQLPDEVQVPDRLHSGTPRQAVMPGMDYSIGGSNHVRVGFARARVQAEPTDQDRPLVEVPVEIAGQFERTNDEDSYRFIAQKGQTYAIDVIADRMASLVDPVLIVQRIDRDDGGDEKLVDIAENDDLRSYFSVHGKDSVDADTRDAALSFTAQEDGEYLVTLVNQFGNGDPSQLYRLAIGEPVEDFQLIATTERPLATNRTGYAVTPLLRRSGRWGVRILAPRQGDYRGDIVVEAQGLPEGVSARPLTLSNQTDEGVLVLSAAADAKSWAGEIQIVGTAQIGSREVRRTANLATLVWGHIFADSIRVRSRLTTRMPASVSGEEEAPATIEPVVDKEWTVEVGKKLEIPIKLAGGKSLSGGVTVEPYGLFGMLRSPPTVTVSTKEPEATLVINFQPNGNFRVEPGRYQFALHATGVTAYRHNQPARERAQLEQVRIAALVEQIRQSSEQSGVDAERSKEIDEKLKRAEAAMKQIDTVSKKVIAAAEEKNEKFAAWSELITVVVKPPTKM